MERAELPEQDPVVAGAIGPSAEPEAPPGPSVTAPPLARIATRPSPKQLRDIELNEAAREMAALLDRYDATFAVEQVMALGPHGGPVYRYVVNIVSR